MCSDLVAIRKLSSILPGWEFSAIDAQGMSGGLLAGWNPRFFNFSAFKTPWGLLLSCHCLSLSLPLTVYNIYGPYKERGRFWDSLCALGIFNIQNLLIAGDLNFTRSVGDIWGTLARVG